MRDAKLIRSERNRQQIIYELNTKVFQDLVEHIMDWVEPNGRGGKRHA